MVTPTRPQFPRSNVSGQIPGPGDLMPGSPAFNWPDRKLYVGDGGRQPILFSQLIRPFQAELAYAIGDLVLHSGEILYATAPTAPNTGFATENWTSYTTNSERRYSTPMATGLLTGGQLAESDSTHVQVDAGSGVVVDASDPSNITYTLVEWSTFTAVVAMTGSSQHLMVTIDASGSFAVREEEELTTAERRIVILLGFVTTDADEIVSVTNVPLPAGNVAEAFRDEYQLNGGAYRVSGVNAAPTGVGMELMLTAGTIFAIGGSFRNASNNPNVITWPERNPISFTVIDSNGDEVGTADAVDPDNWDNDGVLQPLDTGKASIQYLFQRLGGELVLQIGQTPYADISAALLHLGFDYESFVPAEVNLSQMVLAAVVIAEGTTDLSNANLARVVPASVGRGGLPFPKQFIAPDQDLSGYLKLDGSEAMTGDLDMDGNAITNFVIDEGTF